jgi:hypothetical protein
MYHVYMDDFKWLRVRGDYTIVEWATWGCHLKSFQMPLHIFIYIVLGDWLATYTLTILGSFEQGLYASE